ncbi:MAG: SDR family NAD(P)-dependent oxidoreductase [Gammaproteobacteria bacterium]|nr:SDR family NAD(P)-dependent oxidoreductase [Gammaproteobacteria bacterium]
MTGMPTGAASALNAELKDKVILVTGASSGIGRELCLKLAAAGAQLIITGRALPRLESLETNLRKAAEPVSGPAPVLLPMNFEGVTGEDLDTVKEAIEKEFGKLDALIQCAAAPGTHAPLESYRDDLWLRVHHVNAQFPILLTQTLMPTLRQAEQPVIAFALDPNADQGQPYWGAYGTSKAALRCFAEQLTAELENSPFTVLGVSLPATLTPGRRQAFPSQNESDLAKAIDSAETMFKEISNAWA